MKHTKGPWRVSKNGEINYILADSPYESGRSFFIADIQNIADGKNNAKLLPQAEANAHLIAAAPDMYELLGTACSMLRKHNEHKIANDIHDLLNKIEGD